MSSLSAKAETISQPDSAKLSPSQVIAAQARLQLASPHLTSTKAPDTPPNTFNDLFDSSPKASIPSSESQRPLPWCIETTPSSRSAPPGTSKGGESNYNTPPMVPFPSSTSSPSNSPDGKKIRDSSGTQTPSGKKATTPDPGVVEGALSRGRYDSKFTKPLDSAWLRSKNRQELEELLTKADKVLKEKEQG